MMSSMIKENGVTFKELEKKFCMGLQDWETVHPGASGKIWSDADGRPRQKEIPE